MTHIYRLGISSPNMLNKARRLLRGGFKEHVVARDCGITIAAVRVIRKELAK